MKKTAWILGVAVLFGLINMPAQAQEKRNFGEKLLKAARKCDINQIVKMSDEKEVTADDLNVTDANKKTILILLAENPSCKVALKRWHINHVIDKGVNLNARDNAGNTALMYAVEKNDSAFVWTLIHKSSSSLREGLDVNMVDNHHRSALILAAQTGDVSKVRFLLEREDIDVNIQDDKGYTALIYAAKGSNRDIVRALIRDRRFNSRLKVDVNKQTYAHDDYVEGGEEYGGHSALMWAVKVPNYQIVSLLIERPELDLSLTDAMYGMTAFDYAEEACKKRTTKEKVFSGDIDRIEMLLHAHMRACEEKTEKEVLDKLTRSMGKPWNPGMGTSVWW